MLITFFRTIFLIILVTLILRLMGKRQIGELQPYELVVTLLLSELAAIPMASSDLPLLSGIIPMLILLLGQLTLSWWTLKSNRVRRFICGKPAVLIERGRIIENELLENRLNLTDLLELLRIKGYADPTQVEYAILETCGQISVIPKAAIRPVALGDLEKPLPPEAAPPVPLILDGKVISNNLKALGLSPDELKKMLWQKNCDDPSEVLYGALDNQRRLLLQTKAWARGDTAKADVTGRLDSGDDSGTGGRESRGARRKGEE